MKSILRFIRTTVTGGILFLFPVVVLVLIFEKALSIVQLLSEPFTGLLPEFLLGFDGSKLISLFLLLLISFGAGLIFRSKKVKKHLGRLEDKVLIYIPGYSLIKSITADTLGEESEHKLTPVRVSDGEFWLLGFLVEEGAKYSTVFLPDAPKYDAGEIRILPSDLVVKIDINANKFSKVIRSYGVGAVKWVDSD
jgi:uncharacterized membrane protein